MSKITIRIHNNDSDDYVDISGDSLAEIRQKAKSRIELPTWDHGWSEVIDGQIYIDEDQGR